MSESRTESGERLSYQAPEIRSLGTIAEITAANPGFGIDSNGYSTENGHQGPAS
ncbi:MAG TPA: hypothetical protein VHU61_15615 [Solirubrobacteraceae bacterium]|jgi:hypothetical protein|nr:hypothetical protein [Solirubrobacteraceae bacterium]